MAENELVISDSRRFASMVALNLVSTLAQIGQFALGTMLLPIALEAKKASPTFIGFTSAIFWLGMLVGLLAAGKITRTLGYRNTVIIGLLMGVMSFILLPVIDWHWWALPAAAIGFGTGLRWIANETWLYRLAPAHARGRIVGIHETLIGLASIIGPLIIVALGAIKPDAYWVAAGMIATSIPPLFAAVSIPAVNIYTAPIPIKKNGAVLSFAMLFVSFGGLIAGLGGWIEGSLFALLPVYNTDIGLTSRETAWLLTILGVGLMVFQFPIGWLADQKGVRWTTKLCGFVAFAITMFTIIFGTQFYQLAIAMFLFGGFTGGLLTLGIIWATQHSTGAELTHNMRQVSVTYTLLSALGPLATGFMIGHSSSASLFWQQLAALAVLTLLLLKWRDA